MFQIVLGSLHENDSERELLPIDKAGDSTQDHAKHTSFASDTMLKEVRKYLSFHQFINDLLLFFFWFRQYSTWFLLTGAKLSSPLHRVIQVCCICSLVFPK